MNTANTDNREADATHKRRVIVNLNTIHTLCRFISQSIFPNLSIHAPDTPSQNEEKKKKKERKEKRNRKQT